MRKLLFEERRVRMHHCTNGGTEHKPQAYPEDLEARLKGADLGTGKGLIQERFKQAIGDVNRKEAM